MPPRPLGEGDLPTRHHGRDPEQRRSEGLHFLRGGFCLKVLIFGHLIPWAVLAQGPAATPAWTQAVESWFVWLFQQHGELSPTVIGFVALSGYCVHRNRFAGADRPFRHFAVRRIFRILPIFLIATIVGILVVRIPLAIDPAKTIPMIGTREVSPACIAAKLSAVASLWPVAHPCDYLGNAALLTVMVQIGIYGLYGAILYTGRRWLGKATCALSLAVAIVIGACNTTHPLLYNWWQNSSLLAFFPFWWIGAAANHPRFRSTLTRALPALLLAWLMLTCLSYNQTLAVLPELRKLVMCLMIARLIVWADGARIPKTPISLLGRVSYSVYAFHGPIIALALLAGCPWWAAAALALAIGVAAHLLIERPIDEFGRRIALSNSSPSDNAGPQTGIAGAVAG